MDHLVDQFYRHDGFQTDMHTAEIVRAAQVSSMGDVQVLARRLAETHDDMQKMHEALMNIMLELKRAGLC